MSYNRFAAVVVLLVAACSSGPQITRTQEIPESADTPYKKILVITLLSKFDSRRYLEDEVVSQLSALGTTAVASTSMMDTRTPMIRDTFRRRRDTGHTTGQSPISRDDGRYEPSEYIQSETDRLLECVHC